MQIGREYIGYTKEVFDKTYRVAKEVKSKEVKAAKKVPEKDVASQATPEVEDEKKGSDEELLKKIIATGNVKISSEQYNAEADRAEYDTAEKTVILSGENSKVISGKNSISGSKITLNQKSGQVKVESSGAKRIKAEFYTKEKASDSFKMEKSEEKKPN